MRVPPRLRSAVTTLAVLVLGLVLGGTVLREPIAEAATLIHGSRLVDHSVAGKKLVNNTLTGTQVKESALSTVPNAAKLGGQAPSAYLPASKVIRFSVAMAGADPAQLQTVATVGRATLVAHCQVVGSMVFSTVDVSGPAGVIANGTDLGGSSSFVLTNDGAAALQTKTVDVAIVDTVTGLAAEGQFSSVIKTSGASCRLFGHLVRDGG